MKKALAAGMALAMLVSAMTVSAARTTPTAHTMLRFRMLSPPVQILFHIWKRKSNAIPVNTD